MRRLLFELSKFDLKPAGSDACDRLTVNDFLEELDIIKTPAFVRLEASKWNPSGCFYIPGFDTDRFPISYKNHYKLLGFCDLRRAHLEKTQAIHTILLHISCLKVFNVAVHYRRTMEIKTELVFYSTVIMIAGRTAAVCSIGSICLNWLLVAYRVRRGPRNYAGITPEIRCASCFTTEFSLSLSIHGWLYRLAPGDNFYATLLYLCPPPYLDNPAGSSQARFSEHANDVPQ
ncbi:hypothetical protein Y032_0331g2735 [Ancylostoma ceylanicum]|uniref:Uncharacterized protein n=1 Tax=Ancylostoma ceylanicum TaxID=53326 RepID=A0A016S0B2_9BILA|nr:hypothetical protein Y032_0331g2735 [Ancylostoma ceylanicum]